MTQFIAHRGFASKKPENTIEAFEFSAKSNAYGIETDIHMTQDGVFVAYHDDSLLRLCGQDKIIENTNFNEIAKARINGKHKIPTLAEFIEICKSGNKNAVVEIKNPLAQKDLAALVQEIKTLGYLENTTFISFGIQTCLDLRKMLPQQPIQFISATWDKNQLAMMAKERIDPDIEWTCLDKKRIQHCKKLGLKVNCWTLNDDSIAKYFEKCGIDFITTNNLGV